MSKHQVLNPQDLKTRISLVLKTLLMNHSPKVCADILYVFLTKHCKHTRVDIELQEFVRNYDKDSS